MLFLVATPCSAAAGIKSQDFVTFSANEINDTSMLYERAKNNVNEAPQEIVTNILNNSQILINGEKKM